MNDRLYELLPALYRIRDAEHGEALRALTGVLEEQLDSLEQDIGGLYEDWFIETCEEWAVPYIGDLLGARLLHDIGGDEVKGRGSYSQRALVANTLSHRRRKGTLSMLEDLARDVTGWGAHAVTFFELLGWTQHLDHLRRQASPDTEQRHPPAHDRVGTVNLRSHDALDRLDGPFDSLAHTVDVRPIGQQEGWNGLRNVGIFLWRLGSYPMAGVAARPSQDSAEGFHFSPLGQPAPLFGNPRRKDACLATEQQVPDRIRGVAFHDQPEAYYGATSDHSLAIYGGPRIDPARFFDVANVLCKDLSNWDLPPAGQVAVDVGLGRLAFAAGEAPADGVTVTQHYGFSADIGGGPYDRRGSLETAGLDDWQVVVAAEQPVPAPAEWRSTIAAAVADWDPLTQPRAVITIADNRTYSEQLDLTLSDRQHLVLQASDRHRPIVRWVDGGDNLSVLRVMGGSGEQASLTLDGLVVEGGIEIAARSLGKLEIRHSTLVPGHALGEDALTTEPSAASLRAAADNARLEVRIDDSLVGALRIDQHSALEVRDSIIDRPADPIAPAVPRVALAGSDDGSEPGPRTTLKRTTIFGEVHVRLLELASEVLFMDSVSVVRRQEGCVRYSYLRDATSLTPRRFRCQPDLALEARRLVLDVEVLPVAEAARVRARLQPDFTDLRYGQPGYGQLGQRTAREIRTGGEDGSEMGAFERLKQPQRQANLRLRLEEYLPYGLEAGQIFVT